MAAIKATPPTTPPTIAPTGVELPGSSGFGIGVGLTGPGVGPTEGVEEIDSEDVVTTRLVVDEVLVLTKEVSSSVSASGEKVPPDVWPE
jgi:hypothetical protein